MLFISELYPLFEKGLEANLTHQTTPHQGLPLTPGSGPVRRLALALGSALLTVASHAATPSATQVLMPMYSPAEVMQGLYSQHLPPLSQRFAAEADALVTATQQYCQSLPTPGTPLPARQAAWTRLHTQWQHTMLAWESLSTPAVGPMLTRRSQRQIDFWPTRPELLTKALAKAPQTLADMETVGTLAKGLPAMELMMTPWRPVAAGQRSGSIAPSVASCRYLGLLAQGVQVEATELGAELATWAAKDWEQTPDDTAIAMAEWVNQWLGGLERLRWAHLEKPLKTAQTLGETRKNSTPQFARMGRETNLAGWRAQWHSLLAQGRLSEAQRTQPPTPGQALVPIEALLLGQGQIALAQRWAQALDAVNTRIDQLPAQASSRAAEQRELLALTAALKAITVLFQNEVASALDIALGFSDADGD
ncbi:hypothetical protein CKO18_20115 [Rhodoferax fermentans]|nr:hypothetical protein [Rhodoferax fermentans]